MTVTKPSVDLTNLPPMDVASRANRLRERFDAAGIDALLVTNLTNIRYLTGFTGSAALLLVTTDGLVFLTDGRYEGQSATQLPAAGVDARILISANSPTTLSTSLEGSGSLVIGLEADAITWDAATRYRDHHLSAHEVVATRGLVSDLRVVKDEGEIARIAAAASIADTALAQVRPRLNDGPTEAEFGLELDTTMRRLGAADVSFETIVASGPNGALPHHRPGSRRIAEGDLVVLDFGALVDGYHSDMTRTVMVGEPTDTQSRMYDVVREAQAAGVAAVRAGVEGRAVDQVCRDVIAAAGWADAFTHGTGHGVGLDIHEDPRVGSTSTATLVDRCVVTVEPGVYLPDHGGVRIEDTVVVTADGCRAVTLTHKNAAV